MPGILNVNNGYNVENKKISSKITFKIGEKFVGKITSKGEGNEVTIKVGDGWQFKAEIDGDVNLENGEVVKFQVEDFKDGKLKLKVIKEKSGHQGEVEKDNFQAIIKKEGLSKDDAILLREMIRRDLPLTKENIRKFKSIIQFSEKLNIDTKESESFIKKYIASKGIDIKSLEGQKTYSTLKEFMTSLKTMSKDDILLFLENNIDLTKENIDSFNKLFKTEGGVTKLFEDLNNKILKNDVAEHLRKESKLEGNLDMTNLKDKSEDIENLNYSKISDNKSNIASKVYEGNSKISVIDILKNIVNENGIKDLTNEVKNIISKNIINFDKSESSNIMNILANTNDDEFIEILKSSISTDKSIYQFTKNDLEDSLSNIFKCNINLSEDDFNMLNEVINKKVDLSGILTEENKNIFIEGGKNNSEMIENNFMNGLDSKDLIRVDSESKINVMKEIVNKALNALESSTSEKVVELLKENINDFKLFNSVSKEYYYLDFPINRENKEYPCKLIIKDDRKDGKKIDKTNVKLVVSVKTLNIGIIDSFLYVNNRNLKVDLKCNSEYIKLIEFGKSQLIEGLHSLGFLPTITVKEKENELTLSTCREFFSDENNRALDITV